MKLLTTATANGPGADFVVRAADRQMFGVPLLGTIAVHGAWDGATVTVEVQVTHDGPWLPLPGAEFTADGLGNLNAYAVAVRAVVSGAGAGTSLTADLNTPHLSEVL